MVITLFAFIPTSIGYISYSLDEPMFFLLILGSIAIAIGFCGLIVFRAEKICGFLKL